MRSPRQLTRPLFNLTAATVLLGMSCWAYGQGARPNRGVIAIQGRVVDDETSDPVEYFALEFGRGKDSEPSKTSWGNYARHVPGSFTRVDGKPVPTRNPRGDFSYFLSARQLDSDHVRWLRVVADGYEPRPISDRPFGAADLGETIAVTVRLKRGRPLIGRVVDHTGRPAAGARLFLIRPSGGTVKVVDDVIGVGSDTGLLDPSVTRAVADEDGRFRLTGIGDAMAVGVSAPTFHLWTVPIPPPGEESTIRLPEPATIRIPYTIDGDEPVAQFSLQFINRVGPAARLTVFRDLTVNNRGEAILRDAPGGAYYLWRMKSLTVGDYSRRDHVEFREFSVEPGGDVVVDFVRDRGGPIVGEVSGPEGEQARMIFVGIEPAGTTLGAGRRMGSVRSLVDITACGKDGQFRTARIPPGEYVAYAVGYRTRPRYGPFIEFMEPIDFSGSTRVTVPPDGDPPMVRIALVGRQQRIRQPN